MDETPTVMIDIARRVGGVGEPVVLADRADVLVIRVGSVVVKAHDVAADHDLLRARFALARHPALRAILLAPIPLGAQVAAIRDGRMITAWPYGVPVDPDDPDAAPWEQAAALLAALHRVPVGELTRALSGTGTAGLPVGGGPARVDRAITRLRNSLANPSAHPDRADDADTVMRALACLPAETPGPRTLVHGDFHLGQLVRLPEADGNPWRLTDIDDLGWGDPAWDLARPAALYAAGVLESAAWQRFLSAYRDRGGVAVDPGQEWLRLDRPARALVVQSAALAVSKAHNGIHGYALDGLDRALVESCARMVAQSAKSPLPPMP